MPLHHTPHTAPALPHLRPARALAGEAAAIFRRAEATAKGIQLLAESVQSTGGSEAVSLRVAEQYLDAFKEIAKKVSVWALGGRVGYAQWLGAVHGRRNGSGLTGNQRLWCGGVSAGNCTGEAGSGESRCGAQGMGSGTWIQPQ